MATISERIQQALEIRNMKQADLIRKTGINKGALSSYISGKYEPKQNNIYLMAVALDVDEAWLMGKDVPMERKEIPAHIQKIIDGRLINEKYSAEQIEEAIYFYEKYHNSISPSYSKEEIDKAIQVYNLYRYASPQIKAAIDALLKPTE